ncbi:MAG: MurR/RpiR family transcriptional regulator [Oscillospiraceae bacterium]|nr:MurR/RpiR family transcriptional regulator [Oscillospiraceae bacterium]
MTTDILSNIHNNMKSFSKGQRRIAAYILEAYDKAAFMTASALGKIADVSESTVVRFAAQLGYEGYPEMQKALQNVVRSRLTSVQRMDVTADHMGRSDVLGAVMHADMDHIRTTMDRLDRQAFEGAVEAIASARRVYIMGVRSSSALACFLGHYLKYILDDVRVITSTANGEMLDHVVRVSPQDVAIAITFPRYCTSTHAAVLCCGQAGAKTIAITDGPASPVSKCVDYLLEAQSDMVSIVDSLVAPMSLINALIAAVAARRRQETEDIFKKLEDIWEQYNVYEKIDN